MRRHENRSRIPVGGGGGGGGVGGDVSEMCKDLY
jgi:hypothetical protein